MEGPSSLTRKEKRTAIRALIGEGYSLRQVARKLGVSTVTVLKWKKSGTVDDKPRRKVKRSVTSADNIRRYKEIHRMDPNISAVEAAELMNMTHRQVKAIRKAIKGRIDAQPSQPVGEGNDKALLENTEGHNKPFPITKPKTKGRRCHCLACFKEFEEDIPETRNLNLLTKNLDMIFILKNVLDLTTKEILELMKLSQGRDPYDWVDFCRNCRLILEEAVEVQKKIRKLERRLTECKGKFIDQMWNSSRLKFKGNVKGSSAAKPIMVTKRVREMILCRRNRNSPDVNPFEEGDREAESRVQAVMPVMDLQQEVVVKQEFNIEGNVDHPVDFSEDLAKPEDTTDNLDNFINANTHSQCHSVVPNLETFASQVGNSAGLDSGPAPLPASTQGICDVCGLEMRPLAIPTHKLMYHDIVMEGYTAKYCDREGCKYKTLYDCLFQRHVKNHESWNRLSCGYCGKPFANKNRLVQHEEIHANAESRPYICEICGSSFAVKTYLYLHTRMSHQKRFFPSTKRKKQPD